MSYSQSDSARTAAAFGNKSETRPAMTAISGSKSVIIICCIFCEDLAKKGKLMTRRYSQGFSAIEIAIVIILVGFLMFMYQSKSKVSDEVAAVKETPVSQGAVTPVVRNDDSGQLAVQEDLQIAGAPGAEAASANKAVKPFYLQFLPFGPAGFICQHVAPVAYTEALQKFFLSIGFCRE